MSCFLCLEEVLEEFLSPCNCKGTHRIHSACFELLKTKVSKCPICEVIYDRGQKIIEFEIGGFWTEYNLQGGQKHGPECGYDPKGQKIYESEWLNGKQVGHMIFTEEQVAEYDIYGHKIEFGRNIKKQKHGIESGYDPKGQKIYVIRWFEGKQLGHIEFV
jgi:antitoxin component YwqK of YwqJK toxin-antitoxin module